MKRFFVLGSGIGYSLSPTIFARLFEIFGEKGEYAIMDVNPENLSKIADICANYDGFNVTKPFKTDIIRYLSQDCSDCGSVNTVTVSDMKGYSTDGAGFIFDLEQNFSGASSSDVLIVGYGGAALACAHALKKCGANVAVTGRNQQKAAEFAARCGIRLFDDRFKPSGVVSCVTQSYVPKLSSKVDFCYDLRYTGQTLSLDCSSAGGLGMLIAQAIYSYSIFTGKQFDNNDLKRLYLSIRETL